MKRETDFFGIPEAVKAIADLLLPRYCLVCGRRLGLYERHICIYCLCDMPYTRYWKTGHNPMADRFNDCLVRAQGNDCAGERYAFAAALFFYQEHNGYRSITKALKYKADIRAGRYFSRQLGNALKEGWAEDVDLVVPVPLHYLRRLRRGYNQAEIIAREVAEILQCEMLPDLLYRRRRTKSQTRLDNEGKRKNVAGAFGISSGYRKRKTAYRHILLIDDVFTTGSTLSACYMALRRKFGTETRISIATLACVP